MLGAEAEKALEAQFWASLEAPADDAATEAYLGRLDKSKMVQLELPGAATPPAPPAADFTALGIPMEVLGEVIHADPELSELMGHAAVQVTIRPELATAYHRRSVMPSADARAGSAAWRKCSRILLLPLRT